MSAVSRAKTWGLIRFFGLACLVGALLVGLGMLAPGIATIAARQLRDWRSIAPLLVGLYYAVMLPTQLVFFIGPNGMPSVALLAFWGLTWALLGCAIWSSTVGRRVA